MKFVDTNIFVRYLVGDDLAKGAACYAFFQRLAIAADAATTSESVIAEIVFVLSSRNLYGLEPAEIAARLTPVLSLRGLNLPERKTILQALDLYSMHSFLDFEDALSVAHMAREGLTEIVSYDHDIDRIEGIDRREPAPVDPTSAG